MCTLTHPTQTSLLTYPGTGNVRSCGWGLEDKQCGKSSNHGNILTNIHCSVGLDLEGVDGTTVLGKLD